MYTLNPDAFNLDVFLRDYWQKKPLLVRGAFKDFVDPIEADELAGLAMEEEIESRLITKQANTWEVTHGPFEDFSGLDEQGWSLLVQAVDHWHPEAAKLLTPFRFLPNWRIDDLMVSFSVPGGGVGPHLDQYDVFIVQGQGKRRWRVGLEQDTEAHIPHPDLSQVKHFEPVIDEILEPGDFIYIPPGCPHDGIAMEASMNYSVGFRAPSQKDLLSSFADYLIDEELGQFRYADPDIKPRDNPGELLAAERQKLAGLMQASLSDPAILEAWLGQYLTQPKHELDLVPPEQAYETEEVKRLADEYSLLRLGGLRCIYHEEKAGTALFINSERFILDHQSQKFASILCNREEIEKSFLNTWLDDDHKLELLTTLINRGYWYFSDVTA